jgi:hypothetical protein
MPVTLIHFIIDCLFRNLSLELQPLFPTFVFHLLVNRNQIWHTENQRHSQLR